MARRSGCINWSCYWNNKRWYKKQEGTFLVDVLAPLAASLVQPIIHSVLKSISGRGFRKAGKDIWIKIFSSTTPFKQYRDY